MMSFRRLIALLLKPLRRPAVVAGALGVASCGGAGSPPQVIVFAGLGEVRLHQVKPVPAARQDGLRKVAAAALGWTREGKWQPVRVIVSNDHPLVRELKAGPVLELVPEDPALPTLWISLAGRVGRSLLETRGTDDIVLRDLPEGVVLDTSWMAP